MTNKVEGCFPVMSCTLISIYTEPYEKGKRGCMVRLTVPEFEGEGGGKLDGRQTDAD